MQNSKLHTPYGVKDFLPDEYHLKREVKKQMEEIFCKYGYMPVSSPTFEYIEVFEGKGSLSSKQMYKFIDRDGEILALRPDMTLPIARIAATNYANNKMPLRLSYIGNAFRYNESYQGKLSEFTQAGVELIGINSPEADAEIIATAINSLLAASVSDFRIDIGQVQFIKGILSETQLCEEKQHKLLNCIITKEFVKLEQLINNFEMPQNVKNLLLKLKFLVGGVNILKEAEALTENELAKNALLKLENIYDILKSIELDKYIQFDLSMVGYFDYYTGIIFRGYTYGTGFWIVDGGRYDNLLNQFGKDLPSVGFAVKIDDLVSALYKQQKAMPLKGAQFLIAFSEKCRTTGFLECEWLRNDGLCVEMSFFGDNVEKNIEYAKSKGIETVIIYKDKDDIIEIKVGEI